ncbi:MAG: 30S ribosomal protein S11 [Candidatus Paceibacterota bacterium]
MGKKKIVKKGGESGGSGNSGTVRSIKKKVASGRLYVQATYNNTLISLTDASGNSICQSSSGAIGFKGAKKGTPFAAAKVAELVAEQAISVGMQEVAVVVKGVGSGRESSIRAFSGKGINLLSVIDVTPVPHNGVRAKKPRRV